MSKTQPFPWDDVMRIGLGVLKLPPDQFWSMTPREFAAAAGAFARPATPPQRDELRQMMQRFPDRTKDDG